jgi:asparagine synthase (glutamine-hydrolysing)
MTPQSIRERAYRRSLRKQLTRSWLRPRAQEDFARALAADEAADPLNWRDSLRRLPRMRAWRLGFHNQDLVANLDGTAMLRPLQETGFLSALAQWAPRWGFRDRDTAMSELFGSLLPEAVVRRSTKAVFNRVVFGEHSRAFVERWTGRGVPADLVDAEMLRHFWIAPVPHALSLTLLQAAWLADAGAGTQTTAYQASDPVAHCG